MPVSARWPTNAAFMLTTMVTASIWRQCPAFILEVHGLQSAWRRCLGARVLSTQCMQRALAHTHPRSRTTRVRQRVSVYEPPPSSPAPASETVDSHEEALPSGDLDEQQPPTDAVAPKRTGRRRKEKVWEGHLAYHTELVLRVDSLTNLGWGVARMEDSWVVMIPFVIPGELVRARIYRNHKNYSEADLLDVLEPSPLRVEPQCKLFAKCGGCQYQHISLDAQREWKQRHVKDVLERTGTLEDVEVNPPIGTVHAYGYRSKITPHYEKPRKGEIGDIGFQKWNSRSLVDVDYCPIATPAINDRLAQLREEVRAGVRQAFAEGRGKNKGATLILRDTQEGVAIDARTPVSDTVRGVTFKYNAGEFFQNNPYVLPLMVDYVIDQAKGPGLRFLVDTYCGGGLFALSASKEFETCFGVEISENAVVSARRNAELNGLHNCHFRAGTASNIFESIAHFPSAETVVVVDPPRKGCDKDFLSQLFKFRPAKVVYVSCDAATQARDAADFVANGYEVVDVQPFDLFPQTRHIECVATLIDTQRRDALS